jgi:hypothetical protein
LIDLAVSRGAARTLLLEHHLWRLADYRAQHGQPAGADRHGDADFALR